MPHLQELSRRATSSTTDTTTPKPIVVAPSQQYDGDDGSWSSFTIQVGTPAQSFRVLPSTANPETWVIAPEGCTPSDPSNCAQLRGAEAFNGRTSAGFATNASTTWTQSGIYTLDLEQSLGYSGNGLYGYDVVGLNGGNSSGGVSLSRQVVAGIADKDYYMGYLGLSDRATSLSSAANSSASLMTNLKAANLIPSLSFGYTAGASYEGKGAFGNLVLGGYDQSRFNPSTLSFSFASNDARRLQVGVQSIIATNTLMGVASFTASGGHLSEVDSSVPHIWLPRVVCDAFQAALGLQYDNNTDLYTVNDTIHTQLRTLKPVFTFKLGNTAYDNGNSTNIVLPYAAFDQQIGLPTYITKTNYFPIRRAANDSQYTIGRTLLQEAYLVVDYQRQNFSLNQAVFSDPLPSANVLTITAPAADSSSGASSGISTGAIAGIVVAIVLLLVALAGFLLWFFRRRKHEKVRLAELEGKGLTMDAKVSSGTDLDSPGYKSNYVEPHVGATEVSGEHQISELQSPLESEKISELPTNTVYEMMGDSDFYGGAGVGAKKFVTADGDSSQAGSTTALVPPSPHTPTHVSPLTARPNDGMDSPVSGGQVSPGIVSPGIVSPVGKQERGFSPLHRRD